MRTPHGMPIAARARRCDMSIEITNFTHFTCDESALLSLTKYSLAHMGVHPDSELSVSLVDEDEMSSLHMQWMDEPGPTDVLSFPMDEVKPHSAASGPALIGDIVLCPSVATEQAKVAGHSAQAELELLTAHGVLHLLGFDHAQPDEEREMFALQENLLRKWRTT